MNILKSEAQYHKLKMAYILCICVVVLGIIVTYIVGIETSKAEKERLTLQAEVITKTLDAKDILTLNGNDSDITNPKYQSIKKLITDLRNPRKDLRFIYLMGHRDTDGYTRSSGDRLFFMVDSENPESKDYSAPGDIYNKTTQELLDSFKNGTVLVEEFLRDEWGTWVSVFIPIKDETGKVIALLGTDTNASEWQRNIYIKQLISILIFITILTVLFVYIQSTKKIRVLYLMLEKKEREDKIQEHIFDTTQR